MEISGLYFLNMKTHGSKYKILESVKYNAASGAVVGKLKFLQTECICFACECSLSAINATVVLKPLC